MKRPMIRIIEEKCDGCGLCVPSCAEGAIQVIDGKARLIGDSLCDGMGACLGDCPQGALVIEEREAAAFDEEAVKRHLAAQRAPLEQWPIKLALLSPLAPFLKGADLVLAADCTAFAHASFHQELLNGRPLAIACPKLDDPERNVNRLAAILQAAGLESITILKMEVPCCGGLDMYAKAACERAGVSVPIRSEVVEIGPAFKMRSPAGTTGGCPSMQH
jgi:NAD-dependent dihydropyrimidine dehydrogenase PreA subunit